MVVVPLYDTLGPDAATYIVNQAQIELIVCDDWTKVRKLLGEPQKVPNLKFVVLTDDCPDLDETKVSNGVTKTSTIVNIENGSAPTNGFKPDEVFLVPKVFWLPII